MATIGEHVQAAERMLAEGRADDAVARLATLVPAQGGDLTLLTTYALALKSAERLDEAIKIYRRAARFWPRSGVAEHNLAGALGDAQLFEESEAAAGRAFAKGLDAPETWLVHARALQGQGRFEAAVSAYRQALTRRPNYADAHADLAGLTWMLTGDLAEARGPIDEALRRWPADPALSLKLSRLLDYTGDPEGAYGVLADALRRNPQEPLLHIPAAQLAAGLDPMLALDHAKRACAAAPRNDAAIATLAQVNLAAGRPAEAESAARTFLALHPDDQYGVALLTTAWRLAGDPRYGDLCDYDRLVGQYPIDIPAGWDTREAFLADLVPALTRMHPFRTHPIGQSVRHGSQTQQTLSLSKDPAILAYFEAIDGPVRRHIAKLGAGDDPLRRRTTGDYRLNGAWSVRLSPGGFHVNHTHPKGWLSSACHLVLPAAVEDEAPQGWLTFGEPGVPTAPRLQADHAIKPKLGHLVLFPSYVWHGTAPFTGDDSRMTIALDVVPA